jgi:hypothetical protein
VLVVVGPRVQVIPGANRSPRFAAQRSEGHEDDEAEPLAILTGELVSSGATVRSAVVDVTDTALVSGALVDLPLRRLLRS